LVALLAGCGGGDATIVEPAPKPEVPAPAPPPRDNAAGAPKPPAPAPTPAPAPPAPPAPAPAVWEPIWREDWTAAIFDGYVRHSLLRCAGQPDDPNVLRGRERFAPGATWAHFGSSPLIARPVDGHLRIVGYTSGAVLARKTFDPARPLRVSAAIELEQAEGAWVGLTLIQDESDYREISLRWEDGRLFVDLYAPCFLQRLVEVEPGARHLALEHLPGEGWRYVVDGAEVHFEVIGHRGAELVGRPRVGVYWTTHKGGAGPVRATVGPVTVYASSHTP
jgi:hypothetical protein